MATSQRSSLGQTLNRLNTATGQTNTSNTSQNTTPPNPPKPQVSADNAPVSVRVASENGEPANCKCEETAPETPSNTGQIKKNPRQLRSWRNNGILSTPPNNIPALLNSNGAMATAGQVRPNTSRNTVPPKLQVLTRDQNANAPAWAQDVSRIGANNIPTPSNEAPKRDLDRNWRQKGQTSTPAVANAERPSQKRGLSDSTDGRSFEDNAWHANSTARTSQLSTASLRAPSKSSASTYVSQLQGKVIVPAIPTIKNAKATGPMGQFAAKTSSLLPTPGQPARSQGALNDGNVTKPLEPRLPQLALTPINHGVRSPPREGTQDPQPSLQVHMEEESAAQPEPVLRPSPPSHFNPTTRQLATTMQGLARQQIPVNFDNARLGQTAQPGVTSHNAAWPLFWSKFHTNPEKRNKHRKHLIWSANDQDPRESLHERIMRKAHPVDQFHRCLFHHLRQAQVQDFSQALLFAELVPHLHYLAFDHYMASYINDLCDWFYVYSLAVEEQDRDPKHKITITSQEVEENLGETLDAFKKACVIPFSPDTCNALDAIEKCRVALMRPKMICDLEPDYEQGALGHGPEHCLYLMGVMGLPVDGGYPRPRWIQDRMKLETLGPLCVLLIQNRRELYEWKYYLDPLVLFHTGETIECIAVHEIWSRNARNARNSVYLLLG